SFPNTLIGSLKVFLRKQPGPAAKTWVEQSVVRPTYSEYGNLTIAEAALHALVAHAARVPGVASPGRIVTEAHGGTVVVHLEPVLYYGNNLRHVARVLQRQVKRQLEELTGMSVAAVNVLVRRLVPPAPPGEAGRRRAPAGERGPSAEAKS
ncbi:MAG: Asp23/Gls24 family envelope stress response protein, partial [Firmicutes bacterium]|nr:Asp23/Gls24 family envelope stress response protein [Bacillota bacterium]